jgi:two-component system, cell cycle sensor histidine kinase and response regulator CckA
MKDRKQDKPRQPTATSGHNTELRRRVEEHLTRPPLEAGAAGSDSLRLLHELQVHQIELQMQNAELQTARDEMESLLEKCSNLYDFAPVGYLTLDRAGSILEINLMAAGLLGVERAGLVGRPFRPFLAAADAAAFEHLLERAFASGSRETCEVALRRDAGPPPLEVRLEALVGADKRECRVALMDITGQKQAERYRLTLGKLESTGVLAGGLAHDFNNLLTIILLNLEPGETPAANDPTLGQRLAAAKQAALSAARLTQQLITFAGGGASIRRATALPQLLKDATALALSGSSVRGEFRLAEDLWSVEVDAEQIGQVIRNVVQNAREAMPAGGVVVIAAEDVTLTASSATGLPPGAYAHHRPGRRDCAGGAAVNLRPLFLDQGARRTTRHGAGSDDLPLDHQKAWWGDHRGVRSGSGHHRPPAPAGDPAGECATRMRARRAPPAAARQGASHG